MGSCSFTWLHQAEKVSSLSEAWGPVRYWSWLYRRVQQQCSLDAVRSCRGSDFGLLQFSRGCPKLQKLELRGCCFSERALALAVLQLASLRYLWVQGYNASVDGNDLLAMVRPFWNIEFIPPRRENTYPENENDGGQAEVGIEHPAQILAYYSLAGRRTDCPDTVIPLNPA